MIFKVYFWGEKPINDFRFQTKDGRTTISIKDLSELLDLSKMYDIMLLQDVIYIDQKNKRFRTR